MGIPKTYYDDNPEDRAFVPDFWAWLKDQPPQAWLYYARRANWDQAERMFVWMIEDERCDRALASWLFWSSDPTYYIENNKRPPADHITAAILKRTAAGGFPISRLHYGRVEVAIYALRAAQALDRLTEPAPFAIPRELCADFEGTNPDLPAYDEETERDLKEMFDYLNGTLPRTDRESWEPARKGGNWWYEKHLKLPARPTVTSAMSDVEAINAVFGSDRSALKPRGSAPATVFRPGGFKRTLKRLAVYLVIGLAAFMVTLHYAPKLAFIVLLVWLALAFFV